jgi:hypothetical protein
VWDTKKKEEEKIATDHSRDYFFQQLFSGTNYEEKLLSQCIHDCAWFSFGCFCHGLYMKVFFFFWIRGNHTSRKAHFMGPGEWVKHWLSQDLTRGARPDSNSRPAMQISNPLPSRYIPGNVYEVLTNQNFVFSRLIKKETNSNKAISKSAFHFTLCFAQRNIIFVHDVSIFYFWAVYELPFQSCFLMVLCYLCVQLHNQMAFCVWAFLWAL